MAADERAIPPMGMRERAVTLVEILGAYPRALRSLKRNDLRSMVVEARRVAAIAPADLDPGQQRAVAVRFGIAVDQVLRFVPTDSRCLAQALVLSRMLARRGIDASLVIGVTPGATFQAHAWLEVAGQPVQPPRGHARLAEL